MGVKFYWVPSDLCPVLKAFQRLRLDIGTEKPRPLETTPASPELYEGSLTGLLIAFHNRDVSPLLTRRELFCIK